MINIRYHIVSITAIFLALGIGTLLGSTFLDRATVDQLDRNIRNAEARIAETEARNQRLTEQAQRAEARDQSLIAAAETLLDGQLGDQQVLVVAAPGVDQATVDTLRQVLVDADADLRGSLSLREDLSFAEGVDGDLAEALDLEEDAPDAAREEVLGRLVDALVAAGAPVDPDEEPADGETPGAGTTTTSPDEASTTAAGATTAPGDTTTSTTTTSAPAEDGPADEGSDDEPATPDGTQPEIVTALLEADLVGLEPGPSAEPDDPILETTGYRYVFVSQPELDPEADALLLDLLPSSETDPPLPAVVVSRSVDPVEDGAEPPPPTAVGLVRADANRSRLYDTVDDIETYLGLSSTVTILGADDAVAAGHYGQGEGATALAPGGR